MKPTLEDDIICICEGDAEIAIMELLLDNNKLLFSWDNIIFGELETWPEANPEYISKKYLSMNTKNKISILRIIDTDTARWEVPAAYKWKVNKVNIQTRPEIEMLVIHAEGHYEKFKKTKMKPSEYCKKVLKLSNVKDYSFVKKYFKDVAKLLKAIKEHGQKCNRKKSPYCLSDLLK